MLAAQQNQEECVKVLLSFQADETARNNVSSLRSQNFNQFNFAW